MPYPPFGKGVLIILGFLLGACPSQITLAQNTETCASELRKAEVLLLSQSDEVEGLERSQIITVLEKCMGYYEEAQQIRAWAALSQAYWEKSKEKDSVQNRASAKIALQNLLDIDPEFDPRNVPVLDTLYNEIATEPQGYFSFTLGTNLTFVNTLQPYQVDNMLTTRPTYSLSPGLAAFFAWDQTVLDSLRNWLWGIELGVENYRYQYEHTLGTTTSGTGNLTPFTTLSFTESQWIASANLHFRYLLVPSDKLAPYEKRAFIPYIYVGIGPQYLWEARLEEVSRAVNPGLPVEPNPAVQSPQDVSVKDQRITFNYAVLGGVGAWLKLGRDYFQVDLRYHNTFKRVNRADTRRFANSELIYQYGYIDDDFRQSYITLSIGYTFRNFDPFKKL